MDDAVHVEVQIVELFSIWIRSSGINWDLVAIDLSGLFFDNIAYDFGLNGLACSCQR